MAGWRHARPEQLAAHTRELRGETRHCGCPATILTPAADPRTTRACSVLSLSRSLLLPPALLPIRPTSSAPHARVLTPACPAQLVVLLSAYAAATTDFGPADLPEDQWPGACTGVGTCEDKYARASEKVDNAGVDDILYRSRPGYPPTDN